MIPLSRRPLLAFYHSGGRLFKVRLRHRVPSQEDRQLACRRGGGQHAHWIRRVLIVRIKKNSQCYRDHLFVAFGSFRGRCCCCSSVLAVFLCKQGPVGSLRGCYGATSSRHTWLNHNVRGHLEDDATGAL